MNNAELEQQQRRERLEAVSDAKRTLILNAARDVFDSHGLDGASMREIARRAGYTPGAIYSYFPSKEEIYGALLAESLERLQSAVQLQLASADTDAERAASAAMGFFRFYAQHPRDLDLGLYLLGGARPHGLTPELNQVLNDRLYNALAPFERALQALGASAAEARSETTAFVAHCVGLLILENTRRIRMFEQDATALCALYVQRVIARLLAA